MIFLISRGIINNMARKTKEDSQRTRDLILDAAEFIFCEKGVAHASMADIAERAGVSRGAIYGHYKNKTEVALAMCGRALEQPAFPGKREEYESSLLYLRAQYLHFLKGYMESGSLQRVLEILYSKCEANEENKPILELRESWEARCWQENMDLMQAAVNQGDLPPNLGLSLACTYLSSLVNGVCTMMLDSLSRKIESWEAVERILDTGLDALRLSENMREPANPVD